MCPFGRRYGLDQMSDMSIWQAACLVRTHQAVSAQAQQRVHSWHLEQHPDWRHVRRQWRIFGQLAAGRFIYKPSYRICPKLAARVGHYVKVDEENPYGEVSGG